MSTQRSDEPNVAPALHLKLRAICPVKRRERRAPAALELHRCGLRSASMLPSRLLLPAGAQGGRDPTAGRRADATDRERRRGLILAPLAYQVAKETRVDPKPFMVGLAICVSAAFCTPIAHESTILVMSPGRYEFKDYLQVGGVMAILTWLVATVVTPRFWPF